MKPLIPFALCVRTLAAAILVVFIALACLSVREWWRARRDRRQVEAAYALKRVANRFPYLPEKFL